MSAAYLRQKGIGSGCSSCYIILEGEQDVLEALSTGAGHAHIAGPPCGPFAAAGRQRRFEEARAKPFFAAIFTVIKTQPLVSRMGNALSLFYVVFYLQSHLQVH